MDEDRKAYWFPAKRYGFGWGFPYVWQGWAVFIIYFGLLALSSFIFPPAGRSTGSLVSFAILTILLIIVCWIKGEPPAWRWGDDDTMKG